MTRPEEGLKTRLDSGRPVFGSFLRYADPGVAELLACQGWDFIVLDAEHGAIEPHNCENLVRACEVRSVAPLVRVDQQELGLLSRLMDAGVVGCHIAGVDSAERARRALGAVRYSADGSRGLAGVRAADYGTGVALNEYVLRANRELVAVAQIESKSAVEKLDELLVIEDIDVFFLGPTDLSLSLGVPGMVDDPSVVEALEQAAEKILAAARPLGVFVADGDAARRWLDRGALYIVVGFEGLMKTASHQFIRHVRAYLNA